MKISLAKKKNCKHICIHKFQVTNNFWHNLTTNLKKNNYILAFYGVYVALLANSQINQSIL